MPQDRASGSGLGQKRREPTKAEQPRSILKSPERKVQKIDDDSEEVLKRQAADEEGAIIIAPPGEDQGVESPEALP